MMDPKQDCQLVAKLGALMQSRRILLGSRLASERRWHQQTYQLFIQAPIDHNRKNNQNRGIM
jgi:hypothetical protein